MPSSTSNFERPIPALPWNRLAFAAYGLAALLCVGWELRVRQLGYTPNLNDTADLWAERRDAMQPDSLVILGDSRPLFDLDLDAMEEGLGRRPIQLAIAGSGAYPILAHLAADENFRGDIILSLVPIMYLAPGGPLPQASEEALQRQRSRSPSDRFSHHVAVFLEERIAFLQQEDLTLVKLLESLEIPNRPGALVPPRFPPCFQEVDRERRNRMTAECAREGSALQAAVKAAWQRLFMPPPPPTWVPPEVFKAEMERGTEARYAQTKEAIDRIRARGGRVVFVRFPYTGWLKEVEDHATPRAETWDRMLRETGAPGIHFEDHPELASFDCPEWSHLSAPDSVEFTRRLVPHLREALARTN
jgi:hypothetical protein